MPSLLAVATIGGLAFVPAASATTMYPLVNCVETTSTGAKIVHFGYDNQEGSVVTRSVAKSEGKNSWLNLIYDGPSGSWAPPVHPWGSVDDSKIDRGQPTTFQMGVHNDVFTVPMTGPQLTWALVGNWATADAESPACPAPETPEKPTDPPTTPPVDTPTPAASTPTPVTTPVTTSGKKTCTSRRTLTIRIRERKGQKIKSAKLVFNGKTLSNSRRTTDGRVVAKLDFRKLPSGRFTVQIKAKLTNGKTKTYSRKYYTCKPKWGPANNLASKKSL
ncbi:MAG: hypothetical protein JHC95_19790 [Solirubrobacteraceae bacterium]|nr:hypothetical protein [Solirubrobacteraceae bacterium]